MKKMQWSTGKYLDELLSSFEERDQGSYEQGGEGVKIVMMGKITDSWPELVAVQELRTETGGTCMGPK